jgi:prevent-host-death family protein
MAETIGVRELRQYASTYLARVKAGESITVTERGKPIARLVPLGGGAADWEAAWVDQGRLRPAVLPPASWLEVEPAPLRGDDGRSLLDVLDDLRRDADEPSATEG